MVVGKFPPQLVVTFIDPEFIDTLHVYLPVEYVHRVLPGEFIAHWQTFQKRVFITIGYVSGPHAGCVLKVTALKMHTRGDRFLYYKGNRASTVTAVRCLTDNEMEKICKLYALIAAENPRVLEPHYLQDGFPAQTTTILQLRQEIGKAIWSIHAIIIDVHFLLVTVKCTICQSVCTKQSKVGR